jgi:transposase
LDIELLYLPTYSPKLNLIERLWKFTKKKALYSKCYATFGDFQHAINTLLNCAAHQKPTTSAHEKSTRLGTQIRIAMGKG